MFLSCRIRVAIREPATDLKLSNILLADQWWPHLGPRLAEKSANFVKLSSLYARSFGSRSAEIAEAASELLAKLQ
jgi:hypothetical protein